MDIYRRVLVRSLVSAAIVALLLCGFVMAQEDQSITVSGISSFGLIESLLPQFTEETGIEVELQILPYPQLRQNAMGDLVGGTARSDVYLQDIVWLGEWAENEYVRPLDDLLERDADEILIDDILPGAFNSLSKWNGQTWSMPFGAYYFLMYGRCSWLDEAGLEIPTTVAEYNDEFLSALMDPGQNRYAISMAYQRGTPIASWFLATYTGAGGELLTDPPNNFAPTLDSPEALQVLEAYLSWLDYAPPGAVDFHWFDQTTAMQTGQIGLAGTFSINGTEMAKPENSLAAGDVCYDYMPRLNADAEPVVPFGGWAIAINANTDKVDAAWEFIKWVTSQEVQTELGRINGTPVRFSALRDPQAQEAYPWLPFVLNAEEEGFVFPDYRPRYPFYPRLEEILGLHLSRAALGQETPEEALRQADEEITALLQESGYPVE